MSLDQGPITVVLATDSFLIGDGLAALLVDVTDIEVVGRARDHEELLERVDALSRGGDHRHPQPGRHHEGHHQGRSEQMAHGHANRVIASELSLSVEAIAKGEVTRMATGS